ncbi:hypothetical protein [Leptolyngbya sp. 7M]|uniref:hypothetical protein n=1 Tax=Leptolyngbya sp. 7M TaxID=2812896 RepID=UPI001B8D8F08|nr:hypothetical protein [Leptolyngbya sp. 7M]QYO65127.1 hypothetical protein JVX88_37460 [Leptolyngbya sp. 7M]
MRQIIIQVPRGQGKQVLTIAQEQQGTNLALMEASNSERALDLVILHVSNRKVEALLSQLEQLPDVQITLLPSGVMALHPPAEQRASLAQRANATVQQVVEQEPSAELVEAIGEHN